MDELVKIVSQKTGLPEAQARAAAQAVVDYLKQKLPAPVAGQIDGLLSNDAAVQQAEGVLGGLASKFGKKK